MNNTLTSIFNQQHYDKEYNNNNNNNNNINTEPGVFILSAEDGERICLAYVDNVGPMTAAVAHMIESFLQQGITVDNILLAIEETGFAPRPSAYYLRAILRNWVTYGVSTSKVRHAAASEQRESGYRAKNPALWYQQRTESTPYTGKNNFLDLVRKMRDDNNTTISQ